MTTPEPWQAARERVEALVARRDAVLDETARAWAGFARQQGWSRGDVEALWEGLTEDLVRRYTRKRPEPVDRVRGEVLATMAMLRDRIVTGLGQ